MGQAVFAVSNRDYGALEKYIASNALRKILIVCGSSFDRLEIGRYLSRLVAKDTIQMARFSDFKPNPDYESVVLGVKAFKENSCDSILAVGGGSAMDVAKCIKLYATMPDGCDYIHQKVVPNAIPLMAVPTTAGTGSEATRYAVIYYKGEKQSVTDESCIPSAVFLDSSVLVSLPDYQRKVTMLDALCHAIESYWSVNSTEQSRELSKSAIQKILLAKDAYLANDPKGNEEMLMAANIAGKAINITQTTAGHAMSYKLTGLYGIAHGHAVALCVCKLWPFMVEHTERCIDSRGPQFLAGIFVELADAMGADSPESAAVKFAEFFDGLQLSGPKAGSQADFEILKKSVNPVRLKNNPVQLDESTIESLYHQILGG